MKWDTVQVAKTCLRTQMRDPRKSPEKPFLYIDISSIDRSLKVITSTPEILGADAPSRARKKIREGDVLVSTVRPNLNAVALVPPELDGQIASTGFCVLRPNRAAIEGKYLFYFTTTPDFIGILTSKVRGAHYPAVSDGDVKKIELPLPFLSEQRRIVEILDQANALRKKRAEADAKAACILPALFYKMFGDPITNPKEWPKSHLTTLCKKVTDGTHDTPKPVLKGYPLVTNKHFINGFIDFADTYNISAEDHAAVISRSKPEHGDILYSQIGSLGTACFVDTTQEFSIKNCALFKPDAKRLSGKWLAVLLNTASFRSYALAQASGGLQKYLSLKTLRSFEIINVALEEQLRFEEKYDSVLKICIACKKASHEVDKLFNSILHCAFTGDLTAKWREAHMKELLAEMEAQAGALECQPNKSKQEIRLTSKTSHIALNKATLAGSVGKDFLNFRPAHLKIQEDMERLSRAVKPSYLSVYEQMERAIEPIRRRHLEMTRSIEFSKLASSRLTEIVQANQCWQDLIDQATTSTRAIEDFSRTHQTWLDKIKPMQDSIAQLQAAAKMSLGDVAYRMTVTERIFAGIDFEAMRRAVALPESAFLKLENVIGDVTLTYEKLAASIRTIPDVTHLPVFILPGATREVFMTGYALDAIYIPDEPDREKDASEVQLITEVEQETSGCIRLLQAVDPALARPYIGAHDALRGRNADRTRHILSSLRELWNHLLRRLAPDERVWPWVDSQGSRERLCKKGELLFVKDGKENLTRGSRVLFVCRNLNHPPLTDFVVQDTHALVKLVEFFNRVHELEPELTDEQLRALLLRTDSWLTYILQIWKGTR